MSCFVLRAATLLDPEAREPQAGALLVRDGRIEARLGAGEAPPLDAAPIDLGNSYLAPGFLDLHFHGSMIFSKPQQLHAPLEHDAKFLARHGVTAFLPTTVAMDALTSHHFVTQFVQTWAQTDLLGAYPLGLHLEGPWINSLAAGAQPKSAIRAYDESEGCELLDRASGCIKMVTLAPEIEGSEHLLCDLKKRNIIAALGHSWALAESVERGIEQGLRHVTHLFNAMGGVHHRERGAAGVALADDRLTCDLICDGVHVHPDLVRVAARAKREKLLFISDRIELPSHAGASFGSGEVQDDGQALRLPDGRLAGSSLTLDRAIRNSVTYGAMTQLEAIAACTLGPARLLGIEGERGTLRVGARADFAVLDAEGRVRETWIDGRCVFSIHSHP